MYRPNRIVLSGIALLSLTSLATADDRLMFNRDIRPLLSDRCFACHGPDANKRKAELRLDTEAGATALIKGKQAVHPGSPETSALVAHIFSEDPEEVMPPADSGKKLSAAEKERLKTWIAQGASWEGHWSYLPPKTPTLDSVDAFVRRKLDQQALTMSPAAEPQTLVRRLSFDLLGLPPEVEAVRAFTADPSTGAYEALVDDMLASPHFGEQLAAYWLDLVRFADTCGYHGDQHRDLALFRDYVIDAFNANKPFDTFTVEQLAGDLLEDPSVDQRIASGYNRLLQTTEEGGSQPAEYRAIYAADRVRNVSDVWLGSTMGCAQCHDHKFDPFSQKDFYSMAAFFADIDEPAVGKHSANLRLPTPEQEAELKVWNDKLAALEATKTKANDDEKKALEPQIAEAKRERDAIESRVKKTLVVQVRKEPLMTRVLARGSWLDETGEVVSPAIPEVFGSLEITDRRATRLDLAKWLVSERNPLTARVFMNRLWKRYFGNALARTTEDVGAQGEWPTHPELLDWLALEFMKSGWNVKHMIKLMVMSDAYRQTSTATPDQLESDPYNRWLARQSRFRLDAETVRDNALAVSGLLVGTIGGDSVKPYQPAGYWAQLNFPKREYQNDDGANQYRRGVYTYWCRTFLHPSLVAFDATTREECTAQRTRSNTPLQSLVLLNDPTYVEAARVFGERIYKAAGDDLKKGLAWAYERALSRPPRAQESTVLAALFESEKERYAKDTDASKALFTNGLAPAPEEVSPQLAAWTSVARALLNLHETITRY